jgi:carbon storage regulator CsrA
MLVLSRKAGEAIVVGGAVRVVVAGVVGASVRLGVQAPPDVAVDREEVHLRKQGPGRGPPEVFTQQEYDALGDREDCLPATFRGRRMYVREGPALAPPA